jgi:hypothetical protein
VKRLFLVACALVLAACGNSSGGGPSLPAQGPPSAQTVAAGNTDFSEMQKCSESGAWDAYLKTEQTKDPSQYQTDKTQWDDLKAGGANDSYIAVYAKNSSDCGQFASGTPTGKVVYVFAVRFKDSTSAAANFKTSSKDFHLSDSDIANVKAAGGTVAQGSATGLADNSMVLSIDVGGTSFYIAFWQKKQFEVAIVGYNIPIADGPPAAAKINARIG